MSKNDIIDKNFSKMQKRIIKKSNKLLRKLESAHKQAAKSRLRFCSDFKFSHEDFKAYYS